MPIRRKDPKIDEAVSFLPASGEKMGYEAWLNAMRQAGRNDLVRMVQRVRQSGDAVFEIGDYSDPVTTHTVRRAAPAAPRPLGG